MARLNLRGHEVLSQIPVEVSVRMQKPLSVLDHQRIAMARARMEEAMQIKTDEDLARDLFDFTAPPETVDPLAFFTAYQIADEVPDMPESGARSEASPESSSQAVVTDGLSPSTSEQKADS